MYVFRKGAIGASEERNFQIDTNVLYYLLDFSKDRTRARSRDIVFGNVYGAKMNISLKL